MADPEKLPATIRAVTQALGRNDHALQAYVAAARKNNMGGVPPLTPGDAKILLFVIDHDRAVDFADLKRAVLLERRQAAMPEVADIPESNGLFDVIDHALGIEAMPVHAIYVDPGLETPPEPDQDAVTALVEEAVELDDDDVPAQDEPELDEDELDEDEIEDTPPPTPSTAIAALPMEVIPLLQVVQPPPELAPLHLPEAKNATEVEPPPFDLPAAQAGAPPDGRSPEQRQIDAICSARERFAGMVPYVLGSKDAKPDKVTSQTARKIAFSLFKVLFETAPLPRTSRDKKGLWALSRACDGHISVSTFENWLAKGYVNPDTINEHGDAMRLASALVYDPELRQEAANYLRRIPWQEEEKTGAELIRFAASHGIALRDLLSIDRYRKGTTDFDAYAASVGLTRLQYNNVMNPKHARPGYTTLDKIAAGLVGSDITYADKRLFRQAMRGMPHKAQEYLDTCFEPQSPLPAHVHVDASAKNLERGQALGKFLRLLREVHGLDGHAELADAIAEATKCNRQAALEAVESVSIAGRALDGAPSHKQAFTRTMDADIAAQVAAFAYPAIGKQGEEDCRINPHDQRQRDCVAFLSSPEHIMRPWISARRKKTRNSKTEGAGQETPPYS